MSKHYHWPCFPLTFHIGCECLSLAESIESKKKGPAKCSFQVLGSGRSEESLEGVELAAQYQDTQWILCADLFANSPTRLLKFICDLQINIHGTFVVIHSHVQSSESLNA